LKTRVSEAQQKLDKALEGLNSSLLSQEHMRGQLDTLGMVAGKIGQSSSSDMKQLVAAITKVADMGHVGALTNKQLCDRAFDLAKRLRAGGQPLTRREDFDFALFPGWPTLCGFCKAWAIPLGFFHLPEVLTSESLPLSSSIQTS
jgi:hypothetical protein